MPTLCTIISRVLDFHLHSKVHQCYRSSISRLQVAMRELLTAILKVVCLLVRVYLHALH